MQKWEEVALGKLEIEQLENNFKISILKFFIVIMAGIYVMKQEQDEKKRMCLKVINSEKKKVHIEIKNPIDRFTNKLNTAGEKTDKEEEQSEKTT